MKNMGIEMMLNTVVTEFTDVGLMFANGADPLPTDTVIWTGGVKAPPVVERLAWEKDRMSRLVVDSDLSMPGMPNVYVIGGVADASGVKVRGTLAWAMWKFYYLLSLVGWQNRLRVAFNWFLALLFPINSALAHECAPECTADLCMLRESSWETGGS